MAKTIKQFKEFWGVEPTLGQRVTNADRTVELVRIIGGQLCWKCVTKG